MPSLSEEDRLRDLSVAESRVAHHPISIRSPLFLIRHTDRGLPCKMSCGAVQSGPSMATAKPVKSVVFILRCPLGRGIANVST
jgi:hypothetical protein